MPSTGILVPDVSTIKHSNAKLPTCGPLIDRSAPGLIITQDLGLGMMLWMTQFFPEDMGSAATKALPAAARAMWQPRRLLLPRAGSSQIKIRVHELRSFRRLASRCREMPERAEQLNAFFEGYRSGGRV